MRHFLLSFAVLATACGAGNSIRDLEPERPDMQPDMQPAPPKLLVAGEALHVLSAWTPDILVLAQGDSFPQEKQPWSMVYRVPPDGGDKVVLDTDVYHLLIRKGNSGHDPILTYLTPTTPGLQTLKSTGHLWVCRPGMPKKEIVTPDPPLVLQPALLSPDNAYLLSYGKNDDPLFFTIYLTDLSSGTSIRLGMALSVTVPRWVGFDGTSSAGAASRYVELPNLEMYRPFAVFLLSGAATAPTPVVLPGRLAALLPDGRGLLEGPKLLAADLLTGNTTPLADGPVSDYSAFVALGSAYFIQGPSGSSGMLLRVPASGAPQTVLPAAESLWFLAHSQRIAYLSESAQGGRNMVALDVQAGTTSPLAGHGVGSYRALPGDGVLWHMSGSQAAWLWAPGRKQALMLGPDAQNTFLVGKGRFVVVAGDGTLRLLDGSGQPVAMLADRVDLLLDSLDPEPDGTVIFYSVPHSPAAGIWRQTLP